MSCSWAGAGSPIAAVGSEGPNSSRVFILAVPVVTHTHTHKCFSRVYSCRFTIVAYEQMSGIRFPFLYYRCLQLPRQRAEVTQPLDISLPTFWNVCHKDGGGDVPLPYVPCCPLGMLSNTHEYLVSSVTAKGPYLTNMLLSCSHCHCIHRMFKHARARHDAAGGFRAVLCSLAHNTSLWDHR